MKPAGMPWGKYIRTGLGHRLSVLGEKLGWSWLIYNPIHFYHFHEHALENAPGVIGSFAKVFPQAHKYIDVGAGSGAFAAEAGRLGKQVIAIENSPAGRKLAKKQGVDSRPFDLTAPNPADVTGPFDLAYSFEVAEHLPPFMGDTLVKYMASLAPLVAFTAAHPGQGGTGHINEQPKEYWIEKFRAAGMEYDPQASQQVVEAFKAAGVRGKWFFDNLIIMRKK